MSKKAAGKKTSQKKKPFYRRRGFLWPVGIVLGLFLLTALAFRVSPWPGVLVIRWVFDDNDVKVAKALEKHMPTVAVSSITNEQYRPNDKDALLDVYYPQTAEKEGKKLPVIIWTHGGAWISGSKDNASPYWKLLAAQGFTVVVPNYTLAPAKIYPSQIHQLNDVYSYVVRNANRFHADTENIFIAGDSAGSQLSSQLAALATSPDYARLVGITPSLSKSQLKGAILFCGIYMMNGLTHPDPTLPKIVGWGDDVSVWAYAGTKDFSEPIIRQMSAYYHVTKDFPPTFISGGNDDPLTDAQSRPFATKLQSLGVPVQTLFYPANHEPGLPHEYQFDLDNSDGQNAFTGIVEFIKARMASESH